MSEAMRAAVSYRLLARSTVLPAVPGVILILGYGVVAFVATAALSSLVFLCFDKNRELFVAHIWNRLYVAYFFFAPLALGIVRSYLAGWWDAAIILWWVCLPAVFIAFAESWLDAMR